MIPTATIPIKMANNFGFTAFRSMIIEGSDSAVTPIIKARIVPRPAPFANRLSATGMVPKTVSYTHLPGVEN